MLIVLVVLALFARHSALYARIIRSVQEVAMRYVPITIHFERYMCIYNYSRFN